MRRGDGGGYMLVMEGGQKDETNLRREERAKIWEGPF